MRRAGQRELRAGAERSAQGQRGRVRCRSGMSWVSVLTIVCAEDDLGTPTFIVRRGGGSRMASVVVDGWVCLKRCGGLSTSVINQRLAQYLYFDSETLTANPLRFGQRQHPDLSQRTLVQGFYQLRASPWQYGSIHTSWTSP